MKIDFQRLDEITNAFSTNSVLCIGDIMLDEYISGTANRLSPEAPVPVIHRENVRQVLGGVGNVAANLSALGCDTSVFYVAAQDEAAQKIEQLLSEANVNAYPFTAGSITTKKQRIIAQKQQICRLDSEERLNLTKQQEDKIIHQITSLIPYKHVIFISDYNKGLITPRIAQAIIQEAKKQNNPVLVDPKGNDYTKYKGATLIKPNFSEFKTAMKQLAPQVSCDQLSPKTPQGIQEIKMLASLMRQKLETDNIVVTLGEYGMLAADKNSTIYRPTMAHSVSDVSGAGDTSLAILGAAMGSLASLENALDLSNIGAGIVVGREGTSVLSQRDLRITLRNMFNNETTPMWVKSSGRE